MNQDRVGTFWVGTWFGGVSRADLASGGFARIVRGADSLLALEDNKVRGAVLYGDTRDGAWYCELMSEGRDVGPLRDKLIFGEAVARRQ